VKKLELHPNAAVKKLLYYSQDSPQTPEAIRLSLSELD